MTILYVLGAVLVGWFIGFLDSNLRTAKKIQVAEANAEIKIREAERRIALGSQLSEKTKDNPGLLRLRNENGRFIVEIDGAPVDRALSPDKKKRLVELITIFRPWLDGGAASQPAVSNQTPLSAASQEPISHPLQPVSLASKKPEPEKNMAALSIVQQIDTVLQERLLNTPLEKQGIRLQESPQGGVEVYVGLQKFLTVDDVPDTFVKSEIRGAIADWEEKYTPKL